MRSSGLYSTSAMIALGSFALVGCQTAPAAETDVETQATPASVASVETASVQGSDACPTEVYWGDTHLHTANSADAVFNGVRLTPDDALRFARGETVRSSSGLEAQLDRPLDFLLVSDHAELIGVGSQIQQGNETLMADPTLRRWNAMMNESITQSAAAANELIISYSQGTLPDAIRDPQVAGQVVRSTWASYVQTVERHNEPGVFTAFIGYEYTSLPNGNNLHRNVIFRDGMDVFGNTMPFAATRSQDPEQLWAYLEAYEQRTGGRAMAIPHNGNLSNGLMYALTDFEGDPMTADYAMRRQRWEPIAEVTQIKGDGETHPLLSPDDEFAGFGNAGWDRGNLDMSTEKEDAMLAGEYARSALQRGLLLEAMLGVNPFQFGMIGSTDSHTGLATGDESNFFGKFVSVEPSANRAASGTSQGEDQGLNRGRVGWQFLAGGYAGVWAHENTRGALFDAMARREVYATTGPRMSVRMFAGWDLAESDLAANPCDLYGRAVPMGGRLTEPSSEAPRFLVTALKDPEGANLDRVQIVKGWVDAAGETQERVYDIAWSDQATRQHGADGSLAPVGNTVDIATATYENTIGAVELRTVWSDPDFDPAERAFYYVRVLEIPTPRWPVFDALRYGADLPANTELTAQERAYGSPVWYSPAT